MEDYADGFLATLLVVIVTENVTIGSEHITDMHTGVYEVLMLITRSHKDSHGSHGHHA